MVEPEGLRDHVHIREVEDSDLERLYEYQREPEAIRMAAFPARDHAAFMAHWDKIRADQTVVSQSVLLDDDVAGQIVSWDLSGRQAVGYWIGQAYWGRGIATRALALFLERMQTRPLYAYVAIDNTGSIRVLEKSGFRRVRPQEAPPSTPGEDGVEEVLLVLET